MAKFNRPGVMPQRPTSVLGTTAESIPTHAGAQGWAREEKSELFLLAVSNLVGKDTFYEDAKGRDTRFRDLVRTVAEKDTLWLANLVLWLRRECGMRSAAVVMVAEYAWMFCARLSGARNLRVLLSRPTFHPGRDERGYFTDTPSPRRLIMEVLMRADEPGELLSYWLACYGKPLPKSIKRGLGEAALKLYDEYTAGGWDRKDAPVRYADVVELSQIDSPGRVCAEKKALFKFLLDDRRGRGDASGLGRITARRHILALPKERREEVMVHPEFVKQARYAGLTWQNLAGWVPNMDTRAWEIGSQLMGYMGLAKNLNNFSRAGMSSVQKLRIAQRLIAPEQVRKSGMLPMAFLAAYLNVVDDYWKPVLGEALNEALASVPFLAGRNLILIDTSGSMGDPYRPENLRAMPGSEYLKRWDVAALFGLVLARRCERADIVSFSDSSREFVFSRGESVLRAVERFKKTHLLNSGTFTQQAVNDHFKAHDRVIVLTDEQLGSGGHQVFLGWRGWQRVSGGVYDAVPDSTPVHTFNLAGYKPASAETAKRRFTVGGLSDEAFKMIGYLEAGLGDRWPWQQKLEAAR